MNQVTLYMAKIGRVVLALVLASSLSFTSLALATMSSSSGAHAYATTAAFLAEGDNPTSGSDPDPTPTPTPDPEVIDVGIYYENSATALGYYSNPYIETGEITSKGGTLVFDARIFWNDGSMDVNPGGTSWEVSDSSIASINGSGTLTAHSNGDVVVFLTSHNLTAACEVHVGGQDDSPYVTEIRILDKNGAEIGSSPYVIEEDLSTAWAQFYAAVDVTDPTTGSSTTYSTQNGSLSSQTSGAVSDLYWYVGDSSAGSVDTDTMPGAYRPSRYGVVTLYASSSAGFDGSTVLGRATVTSKDPEGGTVEDGYHPQDSLTVKAYYELYTPEEYGDKAYVVNKEYSLSDLYGLGTMSYAYTALGSGNYWTLTGMGVSLASVLGDTGVNIDGIKWLEFGTADAIDRPVSYSYIFGTDRYYYPNIDINSFAEAEQVFPILAFVSTESRNAETTPDYSGMVENTRFRLLFGSTPEGGTSQYQIKWIHTLYVVLEGGPSYDDGDGEGGGSGDGSGAGGGAGTSDGSAGTSSNSSSSSGSSNSANTSANDSSAGSSDGNSVQSTGVQGGKFSIYQVMNKNDSDVEMFDDGSFFEVVAVPAGATVLVCGGLCSFLWYRRETAPIQLIISGATYGTV